METHFFVWAAIYVLIALAMTALMAYIDNRVIDPPPAVFAQVFLGVVWPITIIIIVFLFAAKLGEKMAEGREP